MIGQVSGKLMQLPLQSWDGYLRPFNGLVSGKLKKTYVEWGTHLHGFRCRFSSTNPLAAIAMLKGLRALRHRMFRQLSR